MTDIPDSTGSTRQRSRRNALAVFILLFVVVAGMGVSWWRMRAEVTRLKEGPAAIAAQEASELLALVGAHMKLPEEMPTIATVEDLRKLQGQTFFKHAKTGDKVMLYVRSKKAILYRPSADKVIEVAYLEIKKTAAR